jgi:hypothetical protein
VRRLCSLTALVAVALAAAAGAAHAGGQARAVGGERALAVSVPAEPVATHPGRPVRTLIRVVNPGSAAVVVRIESRSLQLGDNGRAALGAGPDPRWRRVVRFPAGALRIPAQGYRDIPLVVRTPRQLQPDLYFIGFVVTPVAAGSGSIRVVNRIGSFLTIDVPGPRLRRLAGHLDLPGFVFGSHASGSLRLTNTGHASLGFWGEDDTTSTPGGRLRQARLEPSLLPVGRSRTVVVSGKPRWPAGIVTITARITYPGRTASETRQLVFTRRVVVVSPWLAGAAGGLVAAVAAALLVRRRRRRPSTALAPALHA